MRVLTTPPAARSGLDLGWLLRILWWRRWTAVGVFTAVVGSALAVCLLLPKTYKATATVLVDARRTDPVLGPMAPSAAPPGFIATQVDIINSQRVAIQAVKLLGITTNSTAHDNWVQAGKPGTIEQYYADRMLQGLEVHPSRESNVISIQFTGATPAFAAEVANAFAHSYVDTSVQLLADPARSSALWFDERVRQLRDALETAQKKLSDYQQQHEVMATDERLDIETTRLNELNAQLTTVQGQRTESASRERQAQDEAATSPDVLQSPVIQNLRSDIARAEAKQEELAKQLGPNHPQLQRGQTELDTLKARLDAEMHQVASSLSSNHSVNQQREQETRTALSAQKRHVLELRSQHYELSGLMREVENAQKAYDVAAQRLSQTSLESQAQQTNIQLLSEALPPARKSSPQTLWILMMSALFGSILAMGAAVGKEFVDRRLRSADDAAQILGLPILARLRPPDRPVSAWRLRLALLLAPWQRLRARTSG